MSDPTCFLAQFSDRPCDGQLIRAHLIPRHVIKRERTAAAWAWAGQSASPTQLRLLTRTSYEWVDDSRSWVLACGGPMGNAGHHGMLDASRTLRIPREALPDGLEAFAAELGLTWWLDREYGPQEMAA